MDKDLKKYLKYKKKYQMLKKQIGGTYTIGNFHLASVELGMAEAITFGTLQDQITQHGLGTGVYGFIDYNESNPTISHYNNPSSVLTLFTLTNPLVLSNTYEEEGGETRTELQDFTWLSMNLNGLCNTLYSSGILEPTNEQVQEILSNNGLFLFEDVGGYKGIPGIPLPLDLIVYIAKSFLEDYHLLMTQTTPEQEYYLLMPINYLLCYMNYDGIYNMNDDTGRTGSVKYFFKGEYNARGYRPQFKRRPCLKGRLIFLGEAK